MTSGVYGALAATFLALSGMILPAQAQAPLKKVRIAIGAPALNVTYPWLMLPPILHYWRDQGYDVEVFSGQSSLQSIQLMQAGNADLIEVNSAPLVQAAVGNGIPIRDVMLNTVVDWAVIVPADSPITSFAQFKGKVVGISSLGSGGVGLLKSYMGAQGMDPENDITTVATGMGPTALEALRTGRVQGLMYWGSAIASFETAGFKFRSFFDPAWRKLPDFSLATLKSTIDRDPAMVQAIVRGAAMASEFAVANPDCVRRLHWLHYPDTKPTGDSEEALAAADLHRIEAGNDSLLLAKNLSGGELWGRVTGEEFAGLQDFFIKTSLIDHKLPDPGDYVITTPGFFEQANDFDHAAIVAQAKACTMQ